MLPKEVPPAGARLGSSLPEASDLLGNVAAGIIELDSLLAVALEAIRSQPKKSTAVVARLDTLLVGMQALRLAAILERPVQELEEQAAGVSLALDQVHALATRARVGQHSLLALRLAKSLGQRLSKQLNQLSKPLS